VNHHSLAPLGVLRHKMTNDTKGRRLQDPRESGPTSGTRTGGK